tara:strand:+ start:113 stop:304 length:192 start_codon:yes stop_codon:yes gene_type:complete
MKVGDLVHISIHSPLYSYVGGVGIIVSTMPPTPVTSQHYKIFINGSLCPYYFNKNELELVEET